MGWFNKRKGCTQVSIGSSEGSVIVFESRAAEGLTDQNDAKNEYDIAV
jgi:hypothetical protein